MILANFNDALTVCLGKKFFDFKGRAKRSEYWCFLLFILLFYIPFLFFVGLYLTTSDYIFNFIYLFFTLIVLPPLISVTVRRLHDIDKSGWFMLLGLIPPIGFFILLYLLAQKGTQGPNKYGDA